MRLIVLSVAVTGLAFIVALEADSRREAIKQRDQALNALAQERAFSEAMAEEYATLIERIERQGGKQ